MRLPRGRGGFIDSVMKSLRIVLPVLLALGVAVYFGYYYLWLEDDERIILGKIDTLVELASKEGDETVFVGVSRARDIADHFTDEFYLDMGRPIPRGRSNRDELTAGIAQARGQIASLRLRVSDRDLVLDEGGERATMELTGRGRLDHQGGRGEEARRFRVEWVKEDGEWLIERVELLEVLGPDAGGGG